jgi:methylated-DNA-[protein]-cysteine S-methyltransferase
LYSFGFESPFGLLSIEVTSRGVRRLGFDEGLRVPALRRDGHKPPGSPERLSQPVTAQQRDLAADVECQLQEYFDGKRREFDLPLDVGRGSEFRRAVWQCVSAIPYATTISYAELAADAGRPGAYRAAGSACGANPIAIIIPCHRVIGSDRKLHGFGGGFDIKRWLLDHEAGDAGGHSRDVPTSPVLEQRHLLES